MAYYSGQAASFAALKTSIETALSAEGFSASNGVYNKAGSFVKFSNYPDQLALEMGRAQSGSDVDDAPILGSEIAGVSMVDPQGNTINYPLNYEIYAYNNPLEIYIIINYNTDFYQHMGFGQSGIPSVTGGGHWFTAMYPSSSFGLPSMNHDLRGGNGITSVSSSPDANRIRYPYFLTPNNSSQSNSKYYTEIDGPRWTKEFAFPQLEVGHGYIYNCLPNVLNDATVLLPHYIVQEVLQDNSSSKNWTPVNRFNNLRITRNDFILPGQTITYGTEQWKVYPFFRRDLDDRNTSASTFTDHSGTNALALRVI